MFKKIAFFALFLAVTGLFAATSVNAQRLVKGSLVKSGGTSTDVLLEAVPEAIPAANLDQCRNGGLLDAPVNCGAGWHNGNAGAQNSHYVEGGSIDYRLIFTNLVPNTPYTITLSYDAWYQNPNNHAIDYLTTYDTNTTNWDVNPCFGVNDGGACGNSNTVVAPAFTSQFPIADDPCITEDNDDAAFPYQWTGWGMNITGSAIITPCQSPGVQAETIQVTVTFTATQTTAVLGWSGHIATQADWGAGNSATAINGSSYHMRIVGNTGWGGQEDRSLSTDAILETSAADAEITGRVLDGYGRAISSAKLTLNNASTGEVTVAYTNTFGYYTFKGVPVGDFFVMTAQHRRYTFVSGSVSFSLEDNIAGMNFQASR